MNEWARHVARMGEIRSAYKILVGKSEGKRSLGKTWCRRMDFKEIRCESVNWIQLVQDRVVRCGTKLKLSSDGGESGIK
jgi:hypothetical protein